MGRIQNNKGTTKSQTAIGLFMLVADIMYYNIPLNSQTRFMPELSDCGAIVTCAIAVILMIIGVTVK